MDRFDARTTLILAVAAGIAAVVGLHATNVSTPGGSQSPPAAHSEIMHQHSNMFYGEIIGAPLEYFVSPRLAPACQMLKEQKFSKATPLFYQDLQAHPDSLGDFVALAQASPAWRPLALKKLEQALLKNPRSSILQFEVGTLLYYDWNAINPNAGRPYPGPIPRAVALIQQAWRSSNEPIVGLMYFDIANVTHPANTTPAAFFSDINDQVVRAASGDKAYAVFQRANQAGWSGPLPTPALTPRADLRQLLGVLIEQLSYARGHITLTRADGTRVFLKRAEPEKAAYLNRWMVLVKGALGEK